MSVQVKGSGTIGGLDEGLVVSGIVTSTSLDISGDIDVDGHTNLDNVNIAGVTTSTGNIYADNYFGNGGITLNNNGNPSVNLTSTSTTGSSRINFGDPDSSSFGKIYYIHDGDYFKFDTAGSERLRITAAGDVGIGTATPIVASGYANLSLAGSTGGQLELKQVSTDTRHYIWGNQDLNIGGGYYNGASSNIIFRVNGATEKLRITAAGNVGIGTDAPTEKFNVFGTNVKPVIGHKTAHTVHYSSYDSQNNTTLEISSSGTGTNVAGLALNNPTTAANTSYKTITFCCSGTSSGEKRGAIIGSNHDEDSSSTVKGNLQMQVNNGLGLQVAMMINHDSHVTKPQQPSFAAYRNTSDYTVNAGAKFMFNTTRHNVGSHFDTSNSRFNAPVAGSYQINFYTIYRGNVSSAYVRLYKNGSRLYGGDIHFTNTSLGSNWDNVSFSQVVYLSQGDYLEIYNGMSGNIVYHGNHWQLFSGWLLG